MSKKRYVFVPASGMHSACVEDTGGVEGEPCWYFGADDDTAKMFCDALNSARASALSEREGEVKGWVPVRFIRQADLDAFECSPVELRRHVSPFYKGVRWSLHRRGDCLNSAGKWEWEPNPSARDDAFFERCRFASLDALLALTNGGAA